MLVLRRSSQAASRSANASWRVNHGRAQFKMTPGEMRVASQLVLSPSPIVTFPTELFETRLNMLYYTLRILT